MTFVCWKWRSESYRVRFEAEHVDLWARGLRRCLRGAPARLVCVTDDPTGITETETWPLWGDYSELTNPSGRHLPSCYRRLRLFDSAITTEMGIAPGAPVAWSDLDVVFVDDVRPVFYGRPEPFVGWKGVGAYRDAVFNGTFVLFRAGQVDYLWQEFDPIRTPKVVNAAKYFGSDQAWLSYRMASKHPGWGVADGVFSFSRDVAPVRSGKLPRGARVVSFNGKWKPWDPDVQARHPWIRDHLR